MPSVKQVLKKSLNTFGLDVHRIQSDTAPRVIDISDNYTRLLNDVNAGMCVPGNLYLFDYAVKNLPSAAPIVEIGLWAGLSTNLLTYYKRRHGRANRIINCDRWGAGEPHAEGVIEDSGITLGEVRAHIRESYVHNVTTFSRADLPYTLEMLSGEMFGAWRKGETLTDIFGRGVRLGGPLSFAFIDGAHDYGNARNDFEMCDEVLERGGFILFDDSAPEAGWEGVQRCVSEVIADAHYELILANPHHLFRKR
jgi:hypothetical protein